MTLSRSSASLAATRAAAMACIARIEAAGPPEAGASPAAAVSRIAGDLAEVAAAMKAPAWVIRRAAIGQAGEGREDAAFGERGAGHRADASAWRYWLRAGGNDGEWPLLYLLRSSGADVVRACAMEAGQRGIFCNDIETLRSPWPKGARPELPLWLASHSRCLPYDPASGEEARAIVLAALRSLYLRRRPGFVYLSAHGDEGLWCPVLDRSRAADAARGMYRVEAAQREEERPRIRLLGAGRALRLVAEAARLLRADWRIAVEIWSCPSYTRLARDAEAAARWNRLHPLAAPRASHLQRCLPAGGGPVIALTGYGAAIARQIGPYLADRFVALGVEANITARHDVRAVDVRDPHWIAAIALKALADERLLPAGTVATAMRRYRLAGA
ncbi:transketolase-like TK C-terminal-containing protein [Streptomyces rimosus]